MSLQSSFLLGASLLIGGIGCGKETPAVAEAPETADVQVVQTDDFEIYEDCLDRVRAQILQFREDNQGICREYPDDRGCSVNAEDITQCNAESLGQAD